MSNQDLLIKYINNLKRKKLLTSFISYIFDYPNIKEYNYIFRIKKENNNVIIDIYDNISTYKLNRYIFDYSSNELKKHHKESIYITQIGMINIKNKKSKIFKLAYLFTLEKNKMSDYANKFLKPEFTELLLKIIK